MAKDLWKGNDSKTGAALYVDNCAACHRTDGAGYKRAFPSLKGNPVVQTEDATSLIHIVLTGSTTPAVKDAVSNLTMPSFGWRLDDQQGGGCGQFHPHQLGQQRAGGQRQRCGEGA